jgi:hypothetical protein
MAIPRKRETGLVTRDLPLQRVSVEAFDASLNQFARDMGLLDCDQPYEEAVAEQFQHPDLEKRLVTSRCTVLRSGC